MRASFGDYRLLAHRRQRGGSLWLGPDHLLEIETAGFVFAFTESYRRIDFRNIQAITYARTSSWIWVSVVLGLMAFVCLVIGILLMAFHPDTGSWVGASIFGAITIGLLIAVLVNITRGPSCVCKLQTAVQVRTLRPVSRLRVAERVVQVLTPLCIAHQGGESVALGAIQLRVATLPSHVSQAVGVPSPAVHLKPPWTGSKLVSAAMALLVFSGLVTVAGLFFANAALFTVNWVLALAAYLTALAALMKGRRFELPVVLRSSLWGAMVAFLLFLGTAFGLFVWAGLAVINGPHEEDNPSIAAYLFLAHGSLKDLGWVAWWIGFLGALPVVLGLSGLSAAPWPAKSAAEAPGPDTPSSSSDTQPTSSEFKP